jgi:hypothetical protein
MIRQLLKMVALVLFVYAVLLGAYWISQIIQ